MKKKKSGKKTLPKKRFREQNRVAMLAISFVLCILLVVLLAEGHRLNSKIQANDKKTTQLEEQIADENARTEDISKMQEEMKSDDYLEKIAKERLGFVKDNEIVFKEAQ